MKKYILSILFGLSALTVNAEMFSSIRTNGYKVVMLASNQTLENVIYTAIGSKALTNYQTGVYLNTVNPPNGFENQTNQTARFDPATRQGIVTPVGSSFRVTAGCKTYTYNNAVTSSVGPAISGGMYVYFRPSDGQFICTNVAWTIDGEAQAIYALYDHSTTSTILDVDERHGVNISDEDHLMRHLTVGSTWASGISISHFGSDTATSAGINGTNTCIAITDSGLFYDEDVRHTTIANGSNGGSTNTAGVFPILYKDNTGVWKKKAGTFFPFSFSGNVPTYWNSAGVETQVTEDQFFVYWLVAFGSANGTNLFLISHPSTYSSTALAQSGATFNNLAATIGGLPTTEMLVAYRLIFNYNAAPPNANPVEVKYAKLRSVDDYRDVPGGVILAGVGAGSGNYELTSEKITAAGGALLTDLNSVSNTLNSAISTKVSTNDIIYDPINSLISGSIITVNVYQSKSIYRVDTSTAITLTNNLSNLTCDGTKQASWETWINYTSTNALSTVWDSRISWINGIPDLTVTGRYKFAFTTDDGINMTAKQIYPTVYPKSPCDSMTGMRVASYNIGLAEGVVKSYYFSYSDTNTLAWCIYPSVRSEYMYFRPSLMFNKAGNVTVKSAIYQKDDYNQYSVEFPPTYITTNMNITLPGGWGGTYYAPMIIRASPDPYDSIIASLIILEVSMPPSGGSIYGFRMYNDAYYRPANELEIKAFPNGGIPR